MMKQKAFTLLEILLVIAAIGILAAIVIVAINPQRQLEQVRTAEVQSSLNTLDRALQQYLIDEGMYPEGLTFVTQEICDTGNQAASEGSISSDCLDLRALVPRYIATIPSSPYESQESGLYAWIHSENNRIALYAETAIEVVGINIPESVLVSGLLNWLEPGNLDSYPSTGTVLFDLSDNEYHASLINGVNYEPSEQAFSFDGTGYIRLNSALRGALSNSDFSISLWVNRSDRTETIVGFVPSTTVPINSYVFIRQHSEQINFRISSALNSDISWNGYHDRWMQVTMTFNNSLNRMRIYYDAELQDEQISSTTINLGNSNMDLGRDGRGNTYMNGKMAQILIYDRELTADEVMQNFAATRHRYQ